MQFADRIKNVPVILIVISLATVIYITEHINGFIWYWIIFPIALPLLSAILQLAGKLKSQITPIAGAITSVLPIPFYLESLTPVSGSAYFCGNAGISAIRISYIVTGWLHYIGLEKETPSPLKTASRGIFTAKLLRYSHLIQ